MVPQRCYVIQQRRGGDRHLFTRRTRFIPEAILAHFRATLWPPAGTHAPRTQTPAGRIDIGARMRQRWG
jgi:DNA helicase II / ATP-dependent DNA helicase PcrA